MRPDVEYRYHKGPSACKKHTPDEGGMPLIGGHEVCQLVSKACVLRNGFHVDNETKSA